MGKKGQIAWNKGLTKETDIRIKKLGEKSSITKKGSIPWNKGKKGLQKGWNKGIPQSESAKEKNRRAHIGIIVSEETKEKHRIPMLKETKEKISVANTGKIRSEETKEKIGQTKIGNTYTIGQKRTKEQKERMRQSSIERYKDPKEREKNIHVHMFSLLDRLVKDKYCPLFTRKLREQVRIRDGYICHLCGRIQLYTDKSHTVHHIHYDKPNCYPDLICLCNSCNAKANFNRLYFESLFMNKLNDRNLLFWTRRKDKIYEGKRLKNV